MRKANVIAATLLIGICALADAPAPYPLTINSRAQTAPPVTVYRAAESIFRVTFTDGDTASDLTGSSPFMAWATNATASVISTASVSIVSGSTGVVDFAFSPSSVNHASGRYIYEVGVKTTAGDTRIYRQGTFNIYGSPYAGGAGNVSWTTNISWDAINWVGLPNWVLRSDFDIYTNSLVIPPQSYTVITNSPWALRSSGTVTNLTVADKLNFSTTFTDALTTGQIAWDSDWLTFRAGLPDGVTGQFFQESHIYGKNVSGQIVTNGMAVKFSGAVGNSGKLEFTLAKAEVGVRPATTLGIATHDIAPNEFGKITWFGNVNELDTTGALYGETGWTNNMLVFLSTNTAGYLTKNEPQAPQPRICVGAVINRHANVGTILVRPTWGIRITEADDVNGTPLTASGQIMVWDNARGFFDFTDNINGYVTTGTLTTTLGNYATTAQLGIFSGIAADASELAAGAVQTNDTAYLSLFDAVRANTNTVMRDSKDARYFKTLENGTSTVWVVTGPFTNFNVTLSSDFLETNGSTRPAWTNHVWPFAETFWVGEGAIGDVSFSITFNDESFQSYWINDSYTDYPVTIPASSPNAQGSAIVSQTVYYVTNVYSTAATDAHLANVEAEIDNVNSNLNACYVTLSNQVEALPASLQPRTVTLYGDFATTNTTGFSSFATSNTASTFFDIQSPTNNQTIARLRYDITSPLSGIVSASVWAATYIKIPDTSNVVLNAGLEIYDHNGVMVSNATGLDKSVSTFHDGVSASSNLTASVTLLNRITNGFVVVSIKNVYDTEKKIRLFASSGFPLALTVNQHPLNYLTDAHVTPATTPDPHSMYLLKTYTNSLPVAGNTVLAMDGTNLTVTGATYSYTATVTNAYKLSLPTNAPACFYGLTIYGTNTCTFSDNLLLLGTKTHTGTNCVAFKPEAAGTWSVLWSGK